VQDRLLKVIEDVTLPKGLFIENLMIFKQLTLRARTEVVSLSAIDPVQTINIIDEQSSLASQDKVEAVCCAHSLARKDTERPCRR
jgi:intracellular sulfur oxidation DsrE/DsrF family protein